MTDRLIPIDTGALALGMYVAELDRSWLHSPFSGKGFRVATDAQRAALRAACRYVYVDPARSEPGSVRPVGRSPDPPGRLEVARALLEDTRQRIAAAVREARQHGRIDVGPLRRAAGALAGQLAADPDATLWVIRAAPAEGLLYRRSLGTAALMVLFGRHLGADRALLGELAIGGMLLDIGKTAVPVPILAKPERLSDAEQAFVRRHVQRGVSILRLDDTVPERVVEMLLGHHERLDGSGYPRRLRGTEIPVFARVAAIVDTFDALTLDRRYATGISPHDALRQLNAVRDRHYDAALVGEFVHAVGVYPTGTRVELVDGGIGVVFGQNADWPLRPAVAVLTDARGQALEVPRLIDAGLDGHIARALPPDTNPEALVRAGHAFAVRR